jgi:phosphatidylserine decarboxylase
MGIEQPNADADLGRLWLIMANFWRRVVAKVDERALPRSADEIQPPLALQTRPFLQGLPSKGVVYRPRQPATQDLKAMIESLAYAKNFEKAIKAVSKQRIPELDRIQTLDQFYFYIDALVTWIPEIRVWDWNGEILHERTVYLRITQFYHYFNQPSLEALQSPIAPMNGPELTPVSRWLCDFAIAWGAFLDTPESGRWLETFKYAPEYSWQDYERPPEQYRTFNEFFARTFKDIDVQRPVASADDDRVIVFPAESTYVGQWAISTPVGPPLPAPPSIVVKHIEWSIDELLADSEHAADFAGGIFCHSFLNTFDYHRIHTPVAGKVLEARFIPGQVYLEVNLEERNASNDDGTLARAVIPQRLLHAEDATGYQFVQCRGLLVLETALGKVAVLSMGMAQISSVVFVTPAADGQQPIVLTLAEKQGRDYEQQVELVNQKLRAALVGKQLSKGEMFSFFQFGGSDCVVVFERKTNVNITAQVGVHRPIRSQYAVSNINR